ncbi:MAG: ATP synthase F1 subunit delta [Saprospiraceae bacterium]|nr:ATP synthase F1 subunit delta [Saprospiraceae bacterium]
MSLNRIATRYAKSLIDLAKDQGKLDVMIADIETIHRANSQVKELRQMFRSPVIPAERKLAVVESVFRGKIDDLMVDYLHLLIKRGREVYAPEITEEFIRQYKEQKHITPVRITSAEPLSDKVMKTLREQILATGLSHENLEIQTVVDPSIIGGFIIEFSDKRYDASIEAKLKDLESMFSKNLYVKAF